MSSRVLIVYLVKNSFVGLCRFIRVFYFLESIIIIIIIIIIKVITKEAEKILKH